MVPWRPVTPVLLTVPGVLRVTLTSVAMEKGVVSFATYSTVLVKTAVSEEMISQAHIAASMLFYYPTPLVRAHAVESSTFSQRVRWSIWVEYARFGAPFAVRIGRLRGSAYITLGSGLRVGNGV